MPTQLVKLRHGTFIWDVLNPYRDHMAKFWAPKNIDEIEKDHYNLFKFYSSGLSFRKAIDEHDNNTSFNDA